MKKHLNISKIVCVILAFGCLWTAGCGGKTGEEAAGNDKGSGGQSASIGQPAVPGQTGNGGSSAPAMDLQSEREELFQKETNNLLGLQYDQGEIIRFRREYIEEPIVDEKGNLEVLCWADIYLDRPDGSSELLFENLSAPYGGEDWYMVQDGSIYSILADYEKYTYTLIKYDEERAVAYEKRLDMEVRDMCQLKDGRVILLLDDGGGLNSRLRLGELNQDTGDVTELSQIQLGNGNYYIGAGAEGLLVLDQKAGIWEANLEDGSRKSIVEFNSTSYQLADDRQYEEIKDIRVSENGEVELLRKGTGRGILEKLAWIEVDRCPVVMRGFHFNNSWIKEAVADFNRKNDTYYISLEEAGEDWDAFATQTSVQIATGGGPALLYGEILSDYIQGMLDKGGFENLSPYMERSGITEEDYFPLAFSTWRQNENIYGVIVSPSIFTYSMDASVLGGNVGEMDIETLVNALYDYEEQAMYMLRYESGDILESFLGSSEDFWG
ncbi:MAG: hypothetical protein NC427_12565 [Ruminococcus flavefaciens]|nr:hypothetical protein [Ruminococcus flavefaciens]